MTTQGNTFEELQVIDLLLFQKEYQQAINAFVVMLNNLASVLAESDQVRVFHHGDPFDESADICQHASFQWQLLLQSELDFSALNLQPILINLHVLHALLMGTCRGSLDDVILAYHQHRNGQYDVDGLLRQLLAWCPNSRAGFSPFDHYQHAPDLVLAQAAACLTDIALISDQADTARRHAIDFLLSAQVRPEQLSRYGGYNLVTHAWMRCSYADDDRKHRVKPFLGQVLERMAKLPRSFLLPASPSFREGKPVLFVPLEGMTRNHAMYRCYAELIVACRQHFHTVGLGVGAKCDQAVAALFDDFEQVENSADANALAKAIEQVQSIITTHAPAMVWFPSVGMDRWVILLANRRMAPLQVMTLGHPATSMSKEIDAVIIDQELVGDAACYSEALVAQPEESVRFQLPANLVRMSPLRELPEDGVVRIVIPSVAQKLTAAFVRCLREVQARASRTVELVFFSGEHGAIHAAVVQNLLRELQHITVYGFLPYNDYIHAINRCHIHACTFPFGGTNSLLDSLRQGLPLVTLEGKEAHARVDTSFIRKVGLPESLICHSEQEYADCLLHLVEHPDELQQLRHFLMDDLEIDRIFLQQGKPELFADMMYRLYQGGREGLKVAGRDIIKPLA